MATIQLAVKLWIGWLLVVVAVTAAAPNPPASMTECSEMNAGCPEPPADGDDQQMPDLEQALMPVTVSYIHTVFA